MEKCVILVHGGAWSIPDKLKGNSVQCTPEINTQLYRYFSSFVTMSDVSTRICIF